LNFALSFLFDHMYERNIIYICIDAFVAALINERAGHDQEYRVRLWLCKGLRAGHYNLTIKTN
jgi:hypothetical protein